MVTNKTAEQSKDKKNANCNLKQYKHLFFSSCYFHSQKHYFSAFIYIFKQHKLEMSLLPRLTCFFSEKTTEKIHKTNKICITCTIWLFHAGPKNSNLSLFWIRSRFLKQSTQSFYYYPLHFRSHHRTLSGQGYREESSWIKWNQKMCIKTKPNRLQHLIGILFTAPH